MSQTEYSRRKQLQSLKQPFHFHRVFFMKHEHRETHHEKSQYHTDQRGQHDKDGNLEYPGSNQSITPEREPYRTDQSPDQSVGHTDRHTEMSTQPNPDHRTD